MTMKTTGPKTKRAQEQQENIKNKRKNFKVLQETAGDKENLAGRSRIIKDTKLAEDSSAHDLKQKQFSNKAVQTDELGDPKITAEDLTSDEPSSDYWRALAEKRGKDLNDSLRENECLKEQIESLEEENRICKEMLDESRTLVEVLQEMVGEQDEDNNAAESS